MPGSNLPPGCSPNDPHFYPPDEADEESPSLNQARAWRRLRETTNQQPAPERREETNEDA